jgi:hypothetical protein
VGFLSLGELSEILAVSSGYEEKKQYKTILENTVSAV